MQLSSTDETIWSADGRLVLAIHSGTLQLAQVADGAVKFKWDRREGVSPVIGLAKIPLTPFVASAHQDGYIRIWDVAHGRYEGPRLVQETRYDGLVGLAWGPERQGLEVKTTLGITLLAPPPWEAPPSARAVRYKSTLRFVNDEFAWEHLRWCVFDLQRPPNAPTHGQTRLSPFS